MMRLTANLGLIFETSVAAASASFSLPLNEYAEVNLICQQAERYSMGWSNNE
jgi:hypothetical protein